MGNSIRETLKQRISKNPGDVISTLNKAGVKLSASETAAIQNGNLTSFTDQQLEERFNAKVLGMLGIAGGGGGGGTGGGSGGSSGGRGGEGRGGIEG